MQTNINTERQERKVLFRVRNLKQYFPVKGTKLFVKANDGIDLDIYEGETVGLVGESGCGKTTFGRVVLQLYHQTYGRTMYYGRTLNSVAPEYVKKTVSTLPAGLRKMRDLAQTRDKLEKEYEQMGPADESGEEDGSAKERYAKLEQLGKARKAAEDAYLDIAQIIGGLMVADDISAVSKVHLDLYQAALARKKAQEEYDLLRLDIEDAKYAAGKNSKEQGKLDALLGKQKQFEQRLKSLDEELSAKHGAIDALRDKYRSHPDFEEHEAARDDGIDLARLTYNEMRVLRRDMQLIFQDPYSSLNPRMTVGQIIGEGLQTHHFFKKNDERQQDYTIEVMEKCGLAPYMLHRYPHQFSGGQRQRIGIARSLAVKPRFVVCDEAVSALDVSIQSQVINLLQDLREQDHLTYLFISHDLSVIKYISDRIGVMYLGNLIELADSVKLFAHPAHPYTVALLAAIPTTDAKKDAVILEGDIPSPINPPRGCKFHTRCQYCTEICKQVVPAFEEIEPGHFVACHHKL